MEIFTGSIDEECLIGNRTKSVPSSNFAQRGGWEGRFVAERAAEAAEEEGDGDGELSKGQGEGGEWANGRELAVPKNHFFYRNAVGGTTDRIHLLTDEVGVRWVEDTARGLKIPD